MKRILSFVLLCITFVSYQSADAMMIGTYKSETEYGLFDGFKFNFKRQKGQKFVEIRSETREEKERLLREKKNPKKPDTDENEQFRFMQQGVVPL